MKCDFNVWKESEKVKVLDKMRLFFDLIIGFFNLLVFINVKNVFYK